MSNNPINVEDLFNTIPYTKIIDKQIVGIKNKILATSILNTELRCDRVLNRYIDTKPFKILDAPGMIDDFYLNLLDWSTSNILSIGLNDTVYAYNYTSGDIVEIYNSDNMVTSIKSNDNVLSIGLNNGKLIFYDLERQKAIMTRKCHETRVGVQAWNQNILVTGDKKGRVIVQDIRDTCSETLIGHKQEVCGLKWSTDFKYLASGGNDNDIRIWYNNHGYRVLQDHKSAVRALAWCPWKSGILATGGGTKDKSIKFWDVYTGTKVSETAVNSQVCTLNYIKKYKELISSHGYVDNNIVLWKASTMKEVISFGKHENRVLHCVMNPDDTIMASVSGDENLKFWKISDKTMAPVKRASIGVR